MKPLTKPTSNDRTVDISIEAQLAELIEEENCLRRMLPNLPSQPAAMQRAVAAAVQNLDAKSVALETVLSQS